MDKSEVQNNLYINSERCDDKSTPFIRRFELIKTTAYG